MNIGAKYNGDIKFCRALGAFLRCIKASKPFKALSLSSFGSLVVSLIYEVP